MNEFTRSLLYVALLVCIPIVTACIQKGIAVFIEFIVAKINDIKVQRLVREIGSAVSDAVAAMNQTYVNDLKSAGTFNEAEQKEALMRAVSAALKSMSSDAQDYIKRPSTSKIVLRPRSTPTTSPPSRPLPRIR